MFWTDKAVLSYLVSKFPLSQTGAWNRFSHESKHLPAAPCWKLALRKGMEVYCCVVPARGSLIKLSPGSWNVISSSVIQARIICLHFTSDGLLDNNGSGPDNAEAMLMVTESVRAKKKLLGHTETGNKLNVSWLHNFALIYNVILSNIFAKFATHSQMIRSTLLKGRRCQLCP